MNICPLHKTACDGDSPRCSQLVDGQPCGLHEVIPSQAMQRVAAPFLGEVLGDRYAMTEFLTQGGMGAIYGGIDLRLEREIVVKVMLDGVDERQNARFEREAKVLAQLCNPHTVTIYDYGFMEGVTGPAYMVMERIRGESLASRVMAGALQPSEVLKIVEGIAECLEEAHALGIVHRDLKPENVMLTKGRGEQFLAKVLDFGIAQSINHVSLTVSGGMLGTPQYMAPEQFGGEVDFRADIYALGLLTYELLTGRRAFDHESEMRVLLMQKFDQAAPLNLSNTALAVQLDLVIQRAIAKSPEDRCSLDSFLADFQEALGESLVVSAVDDLEEAPTVVTTRPAAWLKPQVITPNGRTLVLPVPSDLSPLPVPSEVSPVPVPSEVSPVPIEEDIILIDESMMEIITPSKRWLVRAFWVMLAIGIIGTVLWVRLSSKEAVEKPVVAVVETPVVAVEEKPVVAVEEKPVVAAKKPVVAVEEKPVVAAKKPVVAVKKKPAKKKLVVAVKKPPKKEVKSAELLAVEALVRQFKYAHQNCKCDKGHERIKRLEATALGRQALKRLSRLTESLCTRRPARSIGETCKDGKLFRNGRPVVE